MARLAEYLKIAALAAAQCTEKQLHQSFMQVRCEFVEESEKCQKIF
ncbi:MAG: hypothetical protein OFPI_23360 [Osedax symbiont Rs2]|nr:MAG: hypothetical protein OFPI_23360 [Osedax symbiont Rs2]